MCTYSQTDTNLIRDVVVYPTNRVMNPTLPSSRTISSQHVFMHEHLRGVDKGSIFSPPDGLRLPQIKDIPSSSEPVGDVDYWPPQIAEDPFSCAISRDFSQPSLIHCADRGSSPEKPVKENSGQPRNSPSSDQLSKGLHCENEPHKRNYKVG